MHFITFVKILPKLKYFEGRNYIQSGCDSYSVLCKVGESWISRKGGILEKKGGMTPLPTMLLYLQNPAIFRIQIIFRTLSRHILAYSEGFVLLSYSEPKAYSESCLSRHIQACSGLINYDSYNFDYKTFTFFLHFNLTYFSTKFKKTCFFDCNDIIFNAQLIFENSLLWFLKIALQQNI